MGEVKKACLCGAKNCSGFIGKKSKSKKSIEKEAKGPEEKKDKEKKKKKKKFKVKKLAVKETGKKWEDLCFRYVYFGFLFRHNHGNLTESRSVLYVLQIWLFKKIPSKKPIL